MDLGAGTLSFAYHLVRAGAGILCATRHLAAVLVGPSGWSRSRRVSARPEFRVHTSGAGARRVEWRHHVPPPVAERDGRDHDVPTVRHVVLGHDSDRPR